MLKFEESNNAFAFIKDKKHIAVGTYEKAGFVLLYKDNIYQFTNAMQAFIFLNDEEFNNSSKALKSSTTKLVELLKRKQNATLSC